MGLSARRGRHHGLVPPAGLRTTAGRRTAGPDGRRSRAARYLRPGHRALPGPTDPPLGCGDTSCCRPRLTARTLLELNRVNGSEGQWAGVRPPLRLGGSGMWGSASWAEWGDEFFGTAGWVG